MDNGNIASIDKVSRNEEIREYCKANNIDFYRVKHNDTSKIKTIVENSDIDVGLIGGAKIIHQSIIEMFKLGIIKSVDERHLYWAHGTSHHIGLDVHDPGNYTTFAENMVLSMEPGIYIPEGSKCDKKWWGIAVRIEDDILVTKNGPVNLSEDAPRTSKDIEKMMAKKSVFDSFVLPNLDEK